MSLLKSIATVGGCTAISRVVGFIRDILMARFLGASMMADAFFVAWRFPNLFRSLFAEGTLNVAFVPLFTGELHKKGEQQAKDFARSAFSFLFYILLIFTLIIEVIMPAMTFVLSPGFDEISGKLELATSLSRITFPFLLFVSLVSLLSGVLNSVGKFWAAAFAPVILNLTMIFFLVCLSPLFHGPYAPAYALSCGVVSAGIFELLFLLWHIKKAGFLFGLQGPVSALFHLTKGVKTLLKKMAPGVIGSGVYQINLFLDTFFVSFVGAGAISWLNYAHHVFQLPIGIIGVAIGTALLPVLSKHVKTGEIQQANTHLNRGLEVSLIMSIASCIGMVMLAQPIVATLFQHGVFTPNDTHHTARALMIFALGLPAYMTTKTFSPFFYARGDTTTPVKIAVIGVILNSILALIFSGIIGIGSFRMSMGYAGIALATTCSVWVNTFQYLIKLLKHPEFSFDKLFKARFFKIIESALIMGLCIYFLKKLKAVLLPTTNTFEEIISLFLIIGISGTIYLGCLILTKAVPFKQLKTILRQKLKGKI